MGLQLSRKKIGFFKMKIFFNILLINKLNIFNFQINPYFCTLNFNKTYERFSNLHDPFVGSFRFSGNGNQIGLG